MLKPIDNFLLNNSMITTINLYKNFNGKNVLNNINIAIPKNAVTVLLGPSGSGKSVLLKLIAKVEEPSYGNINYKEVTSSQISLMFQEGALFDSLTVLDNLGLAYTNGIAPVSIYPKQLKKKTVSQAKFILSSVGLLTSAFKYPSQLSGGMRKRVALARALITQPKLALLDDPTAGLDPVASSYVLNLILTLKKKLEFTLIITGHDLRRLIPIADYLIILIKGRVVFAGTQNELKDNLKDPIALKFIKARYDL